MAEKKTTTKVVKETPKEKAPKSQAAAPVMFEDPRIKKFVNYIMRHGKRTVAQKVFADTMKEIQVNGHPNPQAVLETALENAAPDIMVKSKRI